MTKIQLEIIELLKSKEILIPSGYSYSTSDYEELNRKGWLSLTRNEIAGALPIAVRQSREFRKKYEELKK